MKKWLILFLVPMLAAANADGCPDAATPETQAVRRQQTSYEVSQPIHTYDFSLERQRMIELYDSRMGAAQTWSVWRAYSGMITGSCPSSGYPLPYGTQLTSPDRTVEGRGQGEFATVSNPEPNGLFTGGAGSPGTWVFCVIDGAISPVYIEDNVVVYGYPISVDEKTGHVERVGAPTVKLSK